LRMTMTLLALMSLRQTERQAMYVYSYHWGVFA
jgi:hypothetical protein